MKFFDTNVLWGNWQFQGLFKQSPDVLEKQLATYSIERALVRMSDAAICPDVEACNSMLFTALGDHSCFIPAPTINPKLSDWKDQLATYDSPAINLYPGYHGYSLQCEAVCELAQTVCDCNKTVLMTMRLGDPRAANPYCRFPDIPTEEIKLFLEHFPGLKVVLLNVSLGEIDVMSSALHENVYVDIAYIESLNTLERLLSLVPHKQILFGSNSPLFYTEAAINKITKSACKEEIKEQIAFSNASKLIL